MFDSLKVETPSYEPYWKVTLLPVAVADTTASGSVAATSTAAATHSVAATGRVAVDYY